MMFYFLILFEELSSIMYTIKQKTELGIMAWFEPSPSTRTLSVSKNIDYLFK